MGSERVFHLEKPVLYRLVVVDDHFSFVGWDFEISFGFYPRVFDACVVDIVVQVLSLQLVLGGLLLWGSRERVVGGERVGLLR